MDKYILDALSCEGVAPSGPVSAWPKSRNESLHRMMVGGSEKKADQIIHAEKVEASTGQMAKNIVKAAKTAIRGGKVSQEIYEERYSTCQSCPSFIEKSKRCSKCGCFMKAKAWLNGPKANLCPLDKWSR